LANIVRRALIAVDIPSCEYEKMTGWQQIVLGALVSFLSAIIAVYLTNRHSRALAERSGAFRRPKMGLSLLGLAASSSNPPFVWCFKHPGKEDEAAVYRFPCVLTNTGDARCDDVVVTLIGPAECFGNPEGLSSSAVPGVFEGSMTKSQNDLGKLTQVAYRIDKVGANSGFGIDDLIILRPSVNLSGTTHVTTKDNQGVNVSYRFSLAYAFKWNILTPDDRSIHVKTPIYCIAAPTKETVANEFIEIVLAKMIQSHLKAAGQWETIRYTVLGRGIWRKVVIADFGTPEIVSIKGRKGQKGQKVYRLDKETNKPDVVVVSCLVPRFIEVV
jgi:hypothetical protein